MSVQMVLGPSGSGKSYNIYKRIIEDGIKNEDTNYILLVPEQYSMALQKKLVMLHPNKATMNIDVIGFNRLCFRVFDEQGVKPAKVLEDFGKSMMIRKAAGDKRDELNLYAGNLDKSGFIDEIKSLISEMYQYNISSEHINEVLCSLEDDEDNKLLYMKLKDVQIIRECFEEKLKKEYIVAEQLIELLADKISTSDYIKNSVIVLDGFTGFTPNQLKLIRELMIYAKKIYGVFTIDKKYYKRRNIKEHELFYLSHKTVSSLKEIAIRHSIDIDDDIFIEGKEKNRWTEKSHAISFLEKNIFRFPYDIFDELQDDISVNVYDTPLKELEGVAYKIRGLIKDNGYRYKDIAIITGNLNDVANHVERIFDRYDIPYFLDTTIPVRDNPYINSLEYVLRIVKENFSYDSVFAFLKSGVLDELEADDIELLENYVLGRGLRSKLYWSRKWDDDVEDIREYVMSILLPIHDVLSKKHNRISDYTRTLKGFTDTLKFKDKLLDNEALYDRMISIFDKLDEILGEEEVSIDDFTELLKLGLSELTLGVIPSTLDMVMVGDITRTRLEDIKCLFIVGVNDGIIPKKDNAAAIISDSDKERLERFGLELAPTGRFNAFVEQFYLYINMTKPSEKLYLSYTKMSSGNESLRPSYLISRIKSIFTGMSEGYDEDFKVSTRKSSLDTLITGMRQIMDGNYENLDKTLKLYHIYHDLEDENLQVIERAMVYNNVPKKLSEEVSELIKLKLVSQSISRLEKFAGCAYSYFLQYTLELSERKIREIDSRNIGIIIHSAMEHMYRHVHDNMNNDWSSVTDDMRDEMIDRYVGEAFINEYDASVLDEEGRYVYLLDTLKRIGRRTAKVLSKINDEDALKPEYFEYHFSKEIREDKFTMTLKGVVDRGDVYYSPSEQSLRLRIIDYKTGNHEFKISQLYEGLQLQLSIYMNIMLELVENHYNKDKSNAEKLKITPEGMYYYQMTDPYVKAFDDISAEKERENKLKLKGLINDDDEKFATINAFSMYKAKELAQHIVDGEIDKNPMVIDRHSTCEYCVYKEVCRFDTKYGGNRERFMKYTETDKNLLYGKIKEMVGDKIHGVD
ncbi:MAG: exodeoxyribonuclease V subunit gamma [Lachnospiraceae bacterium]|nr:exodeoxyribonuclease V subunit gamma [Lachnospiraceae bacterium]